MPSGLNVGGKDLTEGRTLKQNLEEIKLFFSKGEKKKGNSEHIHVKA